MESVVLIFLFFLVVIVFLGVTMVIYDAVGALFGVKGSGGGLLAVLLTILGLSWLFGGEDGDGGADRVCISRCGRISLARVSSFAALPKGRLEAVFRNANPCAIPASS